jgi:hypothetical protein
MDGASTDYSKYIAILKELTKDYTQTPITNDTYLKHVIKRGQHFLNFKVYVGDSREDYPIETYMAYKLYNTWFKQDPHGCNANWFNGSLYIQSYMTEDEAIDLLVYTLEHYPLVAAWITLDTLHATLLMRWFKLLRYLTVNIMEKRSLYFTIGGEYSQLFQRYDGNNNSQLAYDDKQRLDIIPYVCDVPHLLYINDNSCASVNVHDSIDFIRTEQLNSEVNDTLVRFLASNACQWNTIDCSSFHCYEMQKVNGIIAHYRLPTNEIKTCTYIFYDTIFTRDIIYHTAHTIDSCSHCKDIKEDELVWFISNINKPLKSEKQLDIGIENEYRVLHRATRYIQKAASLRRTRLRGVFKCAAKLLCIANKISYYPGIGRNYLKALQSFTTHNVQRS